VGMLLRRKGFPVIFLGADTPEEQLDTTAAAVNPALVVFSAQQITSAASLQSAARLLNARGIPVAYGGLIFNRLPALQNCIPAAFLGESITSGLIKIERLAGLPSGQPARQAVISTYTELAQKTRQLWPVMVQSINSQLQSEGFHDNHLQEANAFFGGALAAALQLGDPAYLEPDLAWIEALLSQRGLPAYPLHLYLAAFGRVFQETLGPASASVTIWLEKFLSSCHTS